MVCASEADVLLAKKVFVISRRPSEFGLFVPVVHGFCHHGIVFPLSVGVIKKPVIELKCR